MKILVTGATGRVGSRFVPRLLKDERNVSVLVRDRSQEAVASLERLGARVVEGDVTQPDTLADALKEVDVIVHIAAFFRSRDDKEIWRINETGTANLADAAAKAGVKRFVMTSTGLVYTNVDGPGKETDTVSPTLAYPASKVAAEQRVLGLKGHGMEACILRLGFVYGDGDPHVAELGPLLERFHYHPAQRMHMVHHADVAQALMLALRSEDAPGEIFNVADDAPMTAKELLELSEQTANLGPGSAPLEKPWDGLLDTTKIRTKLGYWPTVSTYYCAMADGIL